LQDNNERNHRILGSLLTGEEFWLYEFVRLRISTIRRTLCLVSKVEVYTVTIEYYDPISAYY
jgi:hypothetical protein